MIIMRKILLLTAMTVFLFSGVFAQAGFNPGKKRVVGKETNKEQFSPQAKLNILSENFEGGALPAGWTKIDGDCGWLFGANGSSAWWSVPAHTNYAYANDDACNADMSDVWLITPSMDFTSVTGAFLSFATFCTYDTRTIKASIDGGTTWTDVTTVAEYTEWTTVQVSLAAFDGEADVMLAFHYNDNAEWGYGWAIDDVLVYVPENDDMAAIGASPSFVVAGSNVFPTVTVRNNGSNVQNDFTIDVVINDGMTDVYTSTKTVTGAALASLAEMVYTMDDEWTNVPAGSYTLTATVTLAGDAEPANDEISIAFEALVGIEAWAATTEKAGVYYLGTPSFFSEAANSVGVRGGCVVDDVFYALDGTGNFGSFNASLDTYTVIGALGVTGPAFIISMAYDAINDKLYCLGLEGGYPGFSIKLIEIDRLTGAGTLVATSPQTGTLLAIAASNSGQLYGVMHAETGNGTFYSIDATTAALTLIGDMGAPVSAYFQSMTFDPATDICYFQAFDDVGGLNGTYSIDIATGLPTAFGIVATDQITAVSILGEPASPYVITKTPAANAIDVAIDAAVVVTFNVNVFETDFSGISITPDPGNVVASIVDDQLTLAHDNFDFNTEYTVLIPAGSVNDGTDDQVNDITWSFTTALDPTACNDPSDIVISNIQPFEATVAWTENGIGTQWTVLYGIAGFDPMTEGDQVTVDVTTTTLTELDANTDYEVYVQAICGVETSGWAGPASFTTAFDCGAAISTLPYTNTFDVEDPCWNITQLNINQTWNFDATNLGYTCLYDDVDVAAQDEWLTSPVFDLSAVSDNIAAKFNWLGSYTWAVDPNDNYDMLFKVSTDGTTWATLWDETEAGVFTDWTEYLAVVDITAYAGEPTVWFAFNYVGTDGAQWSVLDFAVEIVSGTQNINNNIVSVYPNPSNGLVNIAVTETSVVSVMDIAGRTVAMYNVNANDEVSFTQSAGMYIVKVESNGKVSTHKLVIE
jgi:hypothetical protein